jgi:Tfp pilus assembly protein PilO
MLAAVAVVVVAGVLMWLPAQRQIAELRRKIAQTQQELMGTQGQTQNMASLAREVQAIRSEIASTSKTIPASDELSELLRELSSRMTALSLEQAAVTSHSSSRGDGYVTLPLQISFKGPSRSAFAFINRIEEMEHLAQVTQLRLQADTQGGVEADVRLSTFFIAGETTP